MTMTINGSGTITGLSAGGLPDASVTAADLANPLTSATITTATVTTLNASSGVLATQNGMTGIAKAWVQFNGTTGSVTGSFNVSSVTRASTGQYTVNYTTAMPNTSYSAVIGGAATYGGGGTQSFNIDDVSATPITTTTLKIIARYSTAFVDSTIVCATVFA